MNIIKKYRSIPAVLLFFAALICLMIQSVPRLVGGVLLLLALIGIMISSWGTFLFTKANKLLSGKDSKQLPKALALYEKAWKYGIPDQYLVIAGSLCVQYGNLENGKRMLEEALSTRDKKVKFSTLVSLSMYYWAKRDIDKAIELAEEARDLNLKDKNLYINLGTYYLAKGETKKFGTMMRDCYKAKLDGPVTVDLEAEYNILLSDYEKAGNLLKTLFDQVKPTYADPYIHYAMVYMHYGQLDEAVKYIKDCAATIVPSNLSIFNEEELNKLADILSNDEYKYSLVTECDKNPISLMTGIIPNLTKNAEAPDFQPCPEFKKAQIEVKEITERGDNASPNTELTAEDEEWLKKHQD